MAVALVLAVAIAMIMTGVRITPLGMLLLLAVVLMAFVALVPIAYFRGG